MTDYRYIKLGYNVDFDHDGTNESQLNLTDAIRADPRFIAFIELYDEALLEIDRALIAAEPAPVDDGHERGPI